MAEWSGVFAGDKVTLTRGGDDWEVNNTFVVERVHMSAGGLTALVAPGAKYHWEDQWEELRNWSEEERNRGAIWKVVEEYTVLLTRYVKANSEVTAVRVRGDSVSGVPILHANDLEGDDYETLRSRLISVEKMRNGFR